MEKQIDEMAKDLCECFVDYDTGTIDIKATSVKLFAKGYRRASEVAREIIEEAEKIFMFTCSSLEAYTDWQNFKKKYTEEGK